MITAAGTAISAPAHAASCAPGTWNFEQSRSGGCAYGRVTRSKDNLGRPRFGLTGSVFDKRSDGSCARVEVKIRARLAPDSDKTFRTCGNGAKTPIRFDDVDTAPGLTGSVQAWSVRLCVGDSCSSYKDFTP